MSHKIQFKHATNTWLNGKEAEVKFYQYELGGTAIRLVNLAADIDLRLTVHMAGTELSEGYVFIKTWSENEGVLEDAIEAGILAPPVARIPIGYTTTALCKLLIEPNLGEGLKPE